ncbi:hypothetical protein R9C00_19635 [Flammeovirgaceae bacterium SG7u.111]|nr:hypothetical protein [Flammeovirgaceae bacterium SG7u.132]WPO33914.1 hypothetical protein R9C00_19635 [Flammeovirgaceae bacterium SG7u.111]
MQPSKRPIIFWRGVFGFLGMAVAQFPICPSGLPNTTNAVTCWRQKGLLDE